MAHKLTWLPEVLREAGLKVAEVEGWTTRGRGDMGEVRGVMLHHTGTRAPGNMPTLAMLKSGRSDLPGPLSQLGLGRDGTFYVIAAGRANHAGRGVWQTVTTGNSSFIGIEAENGGGPADAWPDVQMDAYRRGTAALLRRIGAPATMCCGHREYAQPEGRKIDPRFDMVAFRKEVADVLRGVAVVRPQIPAQDAVSGKPTLRRGARGDDVRMVQAAVGVEPDGKFGPGTEAAVRAFQRRFDLVGDGIVGPKTWEHILAAGGQAMAAE
jgi:peptidoglycan hydrolase-like protein with peptidoglycan-binding domain